MTELTQLEQALDTTHVGKWKRYPAYKDSGVEWLGEIPEHWEFKRLDEHVNLMNGYPFESELFNMENGIPLVRIRDLIVGTTQTFYSGSEISNALVDNGDVLIGMDGDFNICWWQGGKALLNQRLCCLRPKKTINLRYVYYFLRLPLEMINDLTWFTTVKHLSSAQVTTIRFAYPPFVEQHAIVAFLDRETSKINTLIAKKQRLIKLLQEKRAALISHVVTKGLDPAVKMKDSGVAWLGEIPAHWEVRRLKFVVQSMVAGPFGSSLTKDMYTTEGFRVYGQEQVIPANFSIGDYYISEDMYLRMQRYAVNVGDVLVSCVGTFGKVAVVPANTEPGIINPRLVKLVPNRDVIIPVYLGMLLKSRIAFEQMKLSSHGGTMDIINIGLLSEIILPLPPFQEQMMIMAYLERETARIDALISRIGEAIEKLKEYSAALISAAVTGKIDVRDEVGITDERDLGN